MSNIENCIKVKEEQLEEKVTELLLNIGMPMNLNGFYYVRRAIIIVINKNNKSIKSPIIKVSMSKCLYPELATEFETTPSRIERGIRHAIEVSWDRGDVEYLNNLFGSTISMFKGKTTNSEFIFLAADILRLKLKE